MPHMPVNHVVDTDGPKEVIFMALLTSLTLKKILTLMRAQRRTVAVTQ